MFCTRQSLACRLSGE